jgi:hypothetical protein
MKVNSKKNISLALALLMAGAIISSAQASTVASETDQESFVHSNELINEVRKSSQEMEWIDGEGESIIKIFDVQDELIFTGLEIEMDNPTEKLYHQAQFLTQRGGATYYKILD